VEGFGMVFLEANAAGKPVIGGRTGGAGESVAHGDTGFLVDPDGPEELAATLRLLLTNRSLREQLGSAGAHRALTAFSWKTRAQALSELNRFVLTSRHAKGETALHSAAAGRRPHPSAAPRMRN